MIDFPGLPPPAIIEALDYETLLTERKVRLVAAAPEYLRAGIAAALQLESEPLTIELQQQAYTELLLRQRINEAAKASLLAYATGTDLDNRAADYGVSRLLITPADPYATPPAEAIWESDDRLRYRCLLALAGLTTTGSRGAYLFHAMTASANIRHAQVVTPEPGLVRVYLLDQRGDGVPERSLLDTVQAYLSAETRIPLCDTVEVVAGRPRTFTIVATIRFEDGAFTGTGGLQSARQRVQAMLDRRQKLGATVPLSDIYAALQVAGIASISLASPPGDIECVAGEYPRCLGIDLT